ncbi:MAG: hypothetical protein ABSA16_11465 [Thermoguttaceae bacterium]|jgi:hypothetical protein
MINTINILICATFFERLWNADIWYCLPAIIAISLVYSATRHEAMGPILRHSLRTGLWITGFMAVFFLILWLIS